MTPARVIRTLDEIEHRHACLDLGLGAVALKQFAFERGEKAFAHRVGSSHQMRHIGTLRNEPSE